MYNFRELIKKETDINTSNEIIDGKSCDVLTWKYDSIGDIKNSCYKIIVLEYLDDTKTKFSGQLYHKYYKRKIYDGGIKLFKDYYLIFKFDGYGTLYNKSNIEYQGDFKEGKFHGNGTKYINADMKYEGEFKNGNYDGFGKIYSNILLIYEGQFKNGQKYGLCKEYFYIKEDMPLISEGSYFKDNRNGLFKLYGYNGDLINSELYLNGEILTEKENKIIPTNLTDNEILNIYAEKAAYYKEKYEDIKDKISNNIE